MQAEPYICTKGPKAGEIEWFDVSHRPELNLLAKDWVPYASFEREKLNELGCQFIGFNRCGFVIICYRESGATRTWLSNNLIGYIPENWEIDTYAGRILASAKFLKAVCEKEGVEWLPKGEWHVPVKVDPNIPDNEVKFRDERSGEEVSMKIGIDWAKEPPKYERMAEEECDCNRTTCGCGFHKSPPGGCFGCEDDCPKKIERYGNLNPLKKLVDRKLYYTKQEIDERLEGIADILDRLVAGKSNWVQNQKAIADFRSRFLS